MVYVLGGALVVLLGYAAWRCAVYCVCYMMLEELLEHEDAVR